MGSRGEADGQDHGWCTGEEFLQAPFLSSLQGEVPVACLLLLTKDTCCLFSVPTLSVQCGFKKPGLA